MLYSICFIYIFYSVLMKANNRGCIMFVYYVTAVYIKKKKYMFTFNSNELVNQLLASIHRIIDFISTLLITHRYDYRY